MKRSAFSSILLVGACLLVGAPQPYAAAQHSPSEPAQLASDRWPQRAPRLYGSAADWLNTDGKPLDIAELTRTGHVVLIDFWEYTCVNCQRTLPYLKEWNARYGKDGLVIIGIHTPEFQFAQDPENVKRAVKELGISWPVLIDSQYRNWNAFHNNFWPRKYFVSARGSIVADHSGEGSYEQSEAMLQHLLKQANPTLKFPHVMAAVRDTDVPGAVCYPTTQEMYVGARGDEFGQHGNVRPYSPGTARAFRDPGNHADGQVYLNGLWDMLPESVRPGEIAPTTYAAIRYHALGCNAVIKPEEGEPVKVYVTQDGAPVPTSDRGEDLESDAQGTYIYVSEPRMYRLTKNAAFGAHELQLRPTGPGFGLYSFTFSSCTAR